MKKKNFSLPIDTCVAQKRLCLSSDETILSPRGVLPYKRLMGMCRWMGSHFHDWTDYHGVAFSKEFLELERVVHIYG